VIGIAREVRQRRTVILSVAKNLFFQVRGALRARSFTIVQDDSRFYPRF
jgi:hypothetical protein